MRGTERINERTLCPPRTQATFKSPATLGLISEMVKIFVSPDGILRVNVG